MDQLNFSAKVHIDALRKNKDIESDVMQAYSAIKEKYLLIIKKIERLLLEAQYEVSTDVSKASKHFAEISDLYNSIPEDFLELKLPLELKLLRFRLFLAEKRKHALENKWVVTKETLADSMRAIDQSLVLKKSVQATQAYDSAEKAFSQLPRGYIEEKIDLYLKLLERKKAIQLLIQMKQIHGELLSSEKKTVLLANVVSPKRSDASIIDISLKKARLGQLKLALDSGHTDRAKEIIIALSRDFSQDPEVSALHQEFQEKLNLPIPSVSVPSLNKLYSKMSSRISSEALALFEKAKKQERQGLYYRARITLKKVLALEPSFDEAKELYSAIGRAQTI
jgi:tetratricopeptide (TPR) repeat protein